MIMNNISGTSALITDIDRRKALPIIRALGKEGVRVIGMSYKKNPMGKFSKYCEKTFLCPDYRSDPEGFLGELTAICKAEIPSVFYPIEDVVLSLCVQNPDSWNLYTNALLPGEEPLDCAYDKWKTIQLAMQHGIAVPASYCPESVDEVRQLACMESSQWVVKPRKSSGSRGIKYVNDPAQLFETYNQVSQEYLSPIIQERIPQGGEGVGVFFLLGSDSNPLAIFGHRRIREYPVSGGPSTLSESFRDDDLIKQSLKLVKAIGLTGVMMIEYKRDLRTNKFVLMEVNPRFWGSMQLAIHAGVNIPVLYHKAVLGMKENPVLEYPLGVMNRWLLPGDILHFLSNPDRFHLDPAFFKFRSKNLYYDIISADDPWPILGILIEGFRKIVNKDR